MISLDPCLLPHLFSRSITPCSSPGGPPNLFPSRLSLPWVFNFPLAVHRTLKHRGTTLSRIRDQGLWKTENSNEKERRGLLQYLLYLRGVRSQAVVQKRRRELFQTGCSKERERRAVPTPLAPFSSSVAFFAAVASYSVVVWSSRSPEGDCCILALRLRLCLWIDNKCVWQQQRHLYASECSNIILIHIPRRPWIFSPKPINVKHASQFSASGWALYTYRDPPFKKRFSEAFDDRLKALYLHKSLHFDETVNNDASVPQSIWYKHPVFLTLL